MDLSKLDELKELLQNETVLANVWKFFLDHLGENDEFQGLGSPTRHEFLEMVVAQIGQQLFPKEDLNANLRLISLEEQSFLHGGIILNGRVGGILYFEDIQLGLLSLANLPPSINVEYARFSGRRAPRQGPPSVN